MQYARARELIDALHREDPAGEELAYADSVERWVKQLYPEADDVLLLAARCQHLQRWSLPRTSFPDGKAGYLSWRRRLYVVQADKAAELLRQAGLQDEEIAAVRQWVSKSDLRKGNPGTQALEDGAVLTFFTNQLEVEKLTDHDKLDRSKLVDIVRKTWGKVSPKGQEAIRNLDLDETLKGLVNEALAA